MKRIGTSFLLACTLFAASAQASQSKIELTEAQLLHYVGEIRAENPRSSRGFSTCSASRVGRRLILTAEHCLPLSRGQLDGRYEAKFYPSVSHDRVPRSARAVRITHAWSGGAAFNADWTVERAASDYPGQLSRDWAVGYLEDSAFDSEAENGDFVGVLPYGSAMNANLIAVGYGGKSNDHTPLVDYRCGRVGGMPGRAESNFYPSSCYAVPGDSGGPVFVKLTNGMYAQVGVINTGNALKFEQSDPDKALLLAILGVLAKIPDDFRSYFIGSEQFRTTLASVKARYGEFHPLGVAANQQQQQPQPQYTQPRQPQYAAPAYAQPQYQQSPQQYYQPQGRRGRRR